MRSNDLDDSFVPLCWSIAIVLVFAGFLGFLGYNTEAVAAKLKVSDEPAIVVWPLWETKIVRVNLDIFGPSTDDQITALGNLFGKQGWQIADYDTHSGRIIFKRPIRNQAP